MHVLTYAGCDFSTVALCPNRGGKNEAYGLCVCVCVCVHTYAHMHVLACVSMCACACMSLICASIIGNESKEFTFD